MGSGSRGSRGDRVIGGGGGRAALVKSFSNIAVAADKG